MSNILKRLRIKICSNSKYIQLLRDNGMIIGRDCEIYRDVNFGSEPYLIEIGNHVRITSGCKFITHDGGVWVL